MLLSSRCFQNIIGISPLCNYSGITNPDTGVPEPPSSGLYITDLEGINLNLAAKIVNGEDRTGIELIRKKINFAIGLVFEDFARYLNPYFRLNRVLSAKTYGTFSNTFLPFDNLNRGLYIEKRFSESLYSVTVNSVRVWANNDTLSPENLYFYDGPNLLQTFPINLTSAKPVVLPLNYRMETDQLYILMDNSSIFMNNSDVHYDSYINPGCLTCGGGYRNSLSPGQPSIRVTGWDGTAESQRTFGIAADISIGCDIERYYCGLVPYMHYLFLYRSGIELVKEWLHSQRINEYTTLHYKNATILIERWQQEYDQMYKQKIEELMQVVKSMDCGCVLCRGNQYHYQI